MKIEMIRTLTFTFSTKLQNWGFQRSISKDDSGKVVAFPREVIVFCN